MASVSLLRHRLLREDQEEAHRLLEAGQYLPTPLACALLAEITGLVTFVHCGDFAATEIVMEYVPSPPTKDGALPSQVRPVGHRLNYYPPGKLAYAGNEKFGAPSSAWFLALGKEGMLQWARLLADEQDRQIAWNAAQGSARVEMPDQPTMAQVVRAGIGSLLGGSQMPAEPPNPKPGRTPTEKPILRLVSEPPEVFEAEMEALREGRPISRKSPEYVP